MEKEGKRGLGFVGLDHHRLPFQWAKGGELGKVCGPRFFFLNKGGKKEKKKRKKRTGIIFGCRVLSSRQCHKTLPPPPHGLTHACTGQAYRAKNLNRIRKKRRGTRFF
ncbi:hypothetical protein LX36DRAFT_127471 [Colletotrichum falcatum]|nr:hypothetical protein LX36DRAFT_127471 [Colletotrichum falcatum]